MDASQYLECSDKPELSIIERVKLAAPILRAKIDDYKTANSKQGVQTFQHGLLETIKEFGLSEVRWLDAEKIGFHPCNREWQGLVPVDGQDLLLAIMVQGWLWHMVEGLASEIPPDQEGVEWRAVNARLAERSMARLFAITFIERTVDPDSLRDPTCPYLK